MSSGSAAADVSALERLIAALLGGRRLGTNRARHGASHPARV